MTPEDLRNHLILHGIKCLVKRDEVLIQVCVFCGNTRWNLEANPVSGVYHCWTCNAGGRVDVLIKEVTGVAVRIPVTLEQKERHKLANPREAFEAMVGTPAADVPFCVDYCRQRRLNLVDMAVYQLRVGASAKYKDRIIFPLLDYWSRYLVGYVGRSATGAYPKWYGTWLEKKCVTGYRTRSDVHVVVEGAMDGIRVHKAGYNAAVLIGTANVGIEEWAARVPSAHNVVVLLDGDAQFEAVRLYWTIYAIHQNVKLLSLPEHFDPAAMDESTLDLLIQQSLKLEGPC